jgi:hypothetical protein
VGEPASGAVTLRALGHVSGAAVAATASRIDASPSTDGGGAVARPTSQ